MAKKKAQTKKVKTTDWAIGQPFNPPTEPKHDDAQKALDTVKRAIGEP